MRSPSAYRTPSRFRAQLIPGRTHRLTRIPIHYCNRTMTLGQWSRLLGRKPQAVWRDLKRGMSVGDVLGELRDSGKGDWVLLRARLKRMGL